MSHQPRANWPEHTCVAAIIYDAAETLGVAMPPPEEVAAMVGVHVPGGVPNVWNLPRADANNPVGVVLRRLQNLWASGSLPWAHALTFEFVPFSGLPSGDPVAWFHTVPRPGPYVAVGLDYAFLHGETETQVLHVVHVLNMAADRTRLSDPMVEGGRPTEWSTRVLVDSIRWANDGFWVFAKASPRG